MHKAFLITAACALLALTACGGGGGTPVATSGTIAGVLTVGGPVDNSIAVSVGLFNVGGTTPVQSFEAGRVISAATGSIAGRTVNFSFTDVPFGTYEVAAYYEGVSDTTFYYRSAAQTISAAAPNITNFTDEMSFAGMEPWGTISGVIDLTGTWPAGDIVFVGFTPDGGMAPLQYIFTEHQETDGFVEHTTAGQVIFNIANLGYNTWTVGLYGYDPVTHDVSVFGLYDDPVLVHGGDPNITNVNFPADFAGDPGEDPELGSISGTMHLSGPLPNTSGFLAIGANTVPPQAGAPISSFDFEPGDEDANYDIDYVMHDLPIGEYTVGVFVYDFATHTAVYFGSYDGTVEITEQAMAATGIDFDGDVSLID